MGPLGATAGATPLWGAGPWKPMKCKIVRFQRPTAGSGWNQKIMGSREQHLPAGKRLTNYGKSQCLMGKSLINGQFSIAMFKLPESNSTNNMICIIKHTAFHSNLRLRPLIIVIFPLKSNKKPCTVCISFLKCIHWTWCVWHGGSRVPQLDENFRPEKLQMWFACGSREFLGSDGCRLWKGTRCQWGFQDPKMEVLYHIRPYFVGIFPYIGLT